MERKVRRIYKDADEEFKSEFIAGRSRKLNKNYNHSHENVNCYDNLRLNDIHINRIEKYVRGDTLRIKRKYENKLDRRIECASDGHKKQSKQKKISRDVSVNKNLSAAPRGRYKRIVKDKLFGKKNEFDKKRHLSERSPIKRLLKFKERRKISEPLGVMGEEERKKMMAKKIIKPLQPNEISVENLELYKDIQFFFEMESVIEPNDLEDTLQRLKIPHSQEKLRNAFKKLNMKPTASFNYTQFIRLISHLFCPRREGFDFDEKVEKKVFEHFQNKHGHLNHHDISTALKTLGLSIEVSILEQLQREPECTFSHFRRLANNVRNYKSALGHSSESRKIPDPVESPLSSASSFHDDEKEGTQNLPEVDVKGLELYKDIQYLFEMQPVIEPHDLEDTLQRLKIPHSQETFRNAFKKLKMKPTASFNYTQFIRFISFLISPRREGFHFDEKVEKAVFEHFQNKHGRLNHHDISTALTTLGISVEASFKSKIQRKMNQLTFNFVTFKDILTQVQNLRQPRPPIDFPSSPTPSHDDHTSNPIMNAILHPCNFVKSVFLKCFVATEALVKRKM